MRNDKKFKAKNRDESYVKDKRPDIRLGRHKDTDRQKPQLTQSKKNRMYRARQVENIENTSAETKADTVNTETKIDTNSVSAENADDKDTELHHQTETENISQNIQPEFSKTEPSYSSAENKKKYCRKMYRMQKQAKSVDYNFAEQTQKSDNYDISEKVQESKTKFSKNADADFSESVSDRDSNIPFDSVGDTKTNITGKPQPKKRQKLSFEKSDKSDNFESDDKTSDTPKSDSGDIPFDRVTKFEKKAEKAKSKAEKAEQDLPHKRKIKRKRLYDEQRQKPNRRKTRLKRI